MQVVHAARAVATAEEVHVLYTESAQHTHTAVLTTYTYRAVLTAYMFYLEQQQHRQTDKQ